MVQNELKTEYPVQVDIQYCTACDLKKKCEELKAFITAAVPNASVNCLKGPQGAFEIQINEKLVYSKIQKKTYPEFEDIVENAKNVSQNKPMKPVRPTKDECVIM